MKQIHKILVIAIVSGISLLSGFAIETGQIQGRAIEESGEGLPGVRITASGPQLQGLRTVVSLTEGHFHFPLLPVGTYTLTFDLEGFNSVVLQNVKVRLGRATSVTAAMEMSELKKEIVVTAPAPLIDKTSTDTSFLLNRDELDKMPVQSRTIVDVVKFTPGVTGVRTNTRRGTALQGQPSFRGEGEEGNNWIVDGLSISGVRLKNSGLQLNYDSIEEIQIISDPFSPEYGSALGGIINMVTRSGGNDFAGQFSLVFMDKHLQSARQDQLAVVSEADTFTNANWVFNLGGPLIKNRLWFFLSNNLYSNREESRDSRFDYLDIPGGERTTRNNNIFGKLSFALSPNHHLSLTAIFDGSFGQKGGIGIPELYDRKSYSDLILRTNYKGILGPTTYIEAGFGSVIRNSLIEPLSGNLGPAQYYIEDLARSVNNSYGNVTDDQRRLDFSCKLIKYMDTDTFGHHEFSIGMEYYAFSSNFAVDFTGMDEDLFPNDGFDSGTKYYFDTQSGGRGTPTVFYEYGPFDFVNSARGIGLFFKDKVTWGRVTVMAGLRSQTQQCRDNDQEELWSWNLSDFLSPRLSMALDLTGDGRNILKLGWGRFSDPLTTMPLGLLNPGSGLTFRTYRWNGTGQPETAELHDPANWRFETQQGTQPFEIAEGLKPNFLSRSLLEYDRRLGNNWAVQVRYVRSSAKDLLEVLAVYDPLTDYKFLYDNFEYKRRKYRGLEVEVNGKIGSRFFINASYCHATAEGTNPGQGETGSWSQEEGSTNHLGLFGNHIYIPDRPEFAELKDYVDWSLGGLGGRGIGDEGWYGKLPYSVDHDFKLNGILIGPFGLAISTAMEWLSGYHWEKLGYVPYFGGYYSFPEGRGGRETPSLLYIDLGVEKEFQLPSLFSGDSTLLSFRLEVLNITNSQRPISFVKENIPIFGQVWGRQQPRQARITVKIKF